jgi:hypothetical protein
VIVLVRASRRRQDAPGPWRRPLTCPRGRRAPSAAEVVDRPGALLTSSHLVELGLARRAVEAVFRSVPIVYPPGYRRPMIRAEDYRALVESSLYRGDRIGPR